jgi:hypothetical protein
MNKFECRECDVSEALPERGRSAVGFAASMAWLIFSSMFSFKLTAQETSRLSVLWASSLSLHNGRLPHSPLDRRLLRLVALLRGSITRCPNPGSSST